ncbi:hypothetical protein N9T94_00520, partial [bacterium]|nr:hypothetical protein [bacterium]
FSWLTEALFIQFDHNWSGSTLTNGEFVIAEQMTWNYLINWFFYKLPLVFHASVLIYIYIKVKKIKLSLFSELSLIFIIATFTIFSITKPGVYDGLRQFLFLIPFFTIFASDVFVTILEENKKLSRYLIPVMFIYLIFSQFGLGPYKYTYFNEITDIKKISIECNNVDGCGTWPTDYWGYSGKEAAEFINENLLTEKFEEFSSYAWRGNSSSVLFCRPSIATSPYLKKDLNFNQLTTGDYSRSVFYIVTFHRPRFQDDSCLFTLNKIDYSCETIKTFSKNLRFNELKLGYIKECKI